MLRQPLPPLYLTTNEVAEILKCTPEYVRILAKNGRLQKLKPSQAHGSLPSGRCREIHAIKNGGCTMSSKTKIKTPKPTAPGKPQRGFINVGRQLAWSELYDRPQTAVGIEPPSPWRECEIFPGTLEQLQGRYLRQQEAKETAEREAREQIRAAERDKEARCCPSILSYTERLTIKPDQELISMCADEPPITEVCRPLWLARDSDIFVSQLFSDSDILRVTLPGQGAQTAPYSELKQHLSAYSKISANALTIGTEPRRKHIVCRFGGTLEQAWKPISFLTRQASLILLTHCGDAQLEAWFSVAAKKVDDFARLYLRLGGAVQTLVADFLAALPGALVSNPIPAAYQQLHAIGYLRDQAQLRPRNFVLAFNPPKSE
jgi:hypothetical protein